MADLELGLSVTGVEEAVSSLGRVQNAQTQLVSGSRRAFTQTVEQIREEAEWNERISAARGRATSASIAGTRAAQQQAGALRQTVQATQQATSGALQMAQRLQGAAASVATLASALGGAASGVGGSVGRAAGLAASIAGVTANAIQMGATFGPGGAVVAAVSGAIPIITGLVDLFRSAAGEQDNFAIATRSATSELVQQSEQFSQFLSRFQEVREQQATAGRRARGGADLTVDEINADLERQRAIASGAAQTVRGGRASDTSVALRAQRQAEARVRALEAELARRSGAGDTGDAIGEQQARERDRETRALAESSTGEAADVARGMAEAERQQRERQQRAREAARRDAERRAQMTRDLLSSATAGGNFVPGAGGVYSGGDVRAADSLNTSQIDLNEANEQAKEVAEAARDAAKEAAEAQQELAQEAANAAKEFEQGWTSSLDAVIESWREANIAAKAAGTGMISQSRLLERGMVAVGNNIAETIGGTMKGAFEDALGAWLDGSKSFVEAAEEMAKGVIKALTIEAIVQAVTETARAIASFATQDYAGGVAHLAAAAAWGAVGVVAGGVGAAVGAFGGGGADKPAGEGADNRDLSSRSVSERDQMAPVVINLFPQWATQREVDTFLVGGLNSAARDGHQLDPRLLRGMGR